MSDVLILGGGYVGQRLADRLNAISSYRTHDRSNGVQSVQFDLNDPTSWKNLPDVNTVIWTFPAKSLDHVKAFYKSKLSADKKLIVYASTSCYQTLTEDDLVTENHPLELSRDRVVGEEWLRDQGATILVLAGIYGPDREPINWLKKGRITTPDKRVNLIHVDDIVTITQRMINDDRHVRSERFNLADGQALHWKTIADHYQLPIIPSNKPYESKRVNNEKITNWLGDFCFKKLL